MIKDIYNKKEFRLLLSKQRKAISPQRRSKASEEAYLFLREFLQKFSLIASFASLSNEINLWPLNRDLAKQGKLMLPKRANNSLEFYQIDNPDNQLQTTSFSLQEPITAKCKKIPYHQIECILVPALAFDSSFLRIGYGGGYYDRSLLQMDQAIKIGVGFQEQMVSQELPEESHDQRLDKLYLF